MAVMTAQRMTDTHIHLVPGIDDGSVSLEVSLQMLKLAAEQGVRRVFCTSHGWGRCECYRRQFEALREAAGLTCTEIALYTGCEIPCSPSEMSDVLRGLADGSLLPYGHSRHVLAECYNGVNPAQALSIAQSLLESDWTPVLAHIERFPGLFADDTIEHLLELGCLLQVNVYSLASDHNPGIKRRARSLLSEKRIHFLGSDAHSLNHRSPYVSEGLSFVYDNTDRAYADAICFRNADDLLT